MNYIETLRSPRRRLTIVAFVVLLHIVMIYGWFTLPLYGGAHRAPPLIRVAIVKDVPPTPHHAPPSSRPRH